jgi:hypothetical protein
MSSNHCISHRLHLAGKDASKEVIYFKKYEKTLKNLYSYFSKSGKRQKMLIRNPCDNCKILSIINMFLWR